MASRLESFVAKVEAAYVGTPDTTFMVGGKHVDRHDNWNRIVAIITSGPIVTPETGAHHEIHEDTGTPDDIIWERKPTIEWGIWAESFEQCENRLHALLTAIEEVTAQSDLTISDVREEWLGDGESIADGGAFVIVKHTIKFKVLTRDAAIVSFDAETAAGNPPGGDRPTVGEGVPTETATGATIIAKQESETVATVDIDETDSPIGD